MEVTAIMDAKKDCEDQGNSEARIVEITEGAQIFIASISDILKKVQKALSDKENRQAFDHLRMVRGMLFRGLGTFGADFPGRSSPVSFYEMLGELDDVLRLINLVDEGSVEDFGITQKSNELISRFIPIVDSWYELVQGGTYLSGDNDPSISAVDAQKT